MKSATTILTLCLFFLFVGCSNEMNVRKTIVGETENTLIANWGEPLKSEGKDFEFFDAYTGQGKHLYYNFGDKQVDVKIVDGKVDRVSLVSEQIKDDAAQTIKTGDGQ